MFGQLTFRLTSASSKKQNCSLMFIDKAGLYNQIIYYSNAFYAMLFVLSLIDCLIIIIIISIFIEDTVFSTTASLPYGPLVNTDIDYFRTDFFFGYYSDFFIRDMRC